MGSLLFSKAEHGQAALPQTLGQMNEIAVRCCNHKRLYASCQRQLHGINAQEKVSGVLAYAGMH